METRFFTPTARPEACPAPHPLPVAEPTFGPPPGNNIFALLREELPDAWNEFITILEGRIVAEPNRDIHDLVRDVFYYGPKSSREFALEFRNKELNSAPLPSYLGMNPVLPLAALQCAWNRYAFGGGATKAVGLGQRQTVSEVVIFALTLKSTGGVPPKPQNQGKLTGGQRGARF